MQTNVYYNTPPALKKNCRNFSFMLRVHFIDFMNRSGQWLCWYGMLKVIWEEKDTLKSLWIFSDSCDQCCPDRQVTGTECPARWQVSSRTAFFCWLLLFWRYQAMSGFGLSPAISAGKKINHYTLVMVIPASKRKSISWVTSPSFHPQVLPTDPCASNKLASFWHRD